MILLIEKALIIAAIVLAALLFVAAVCIGLRLMECDRQAEAMHKALIADEARKRKARHLDRLRKQGVRVKYFRSAWSVNSYRRMRKYETRQFVRRKRRLPACRRDVRDRACMGV